MIFWNRKFPDENKLKVLPVIKILFSNAKSQPESDLIAINAFFHIFAGNISYTTTIVDLNGKWYGSK